MRQENLFENLERRLWNALATFFGCLFFPIPRGIVGRNGTLLKWRMIARDEAALRAATGVVFFLGLGGVHQRRMNKIREAVFGIEQFSP